MAFSRFLAFNAPLGKLIRLPLRAIPQDATVRILRGPLRGARWTAGASTHGCWLGTYEPAFQSFFFSVVPKGGVVWDVGANVGFYSLLASRKAAKVIAFEPLPENLSYLRRHIELNGLKERVQVIPAAASDRDGSALFTIVPGNRSEGSLGPHGTLPVRTVRLDSLGTVPDVIKIDVEGNEYSVLLGAIATMRNHHPLVLVARHSGDSYCQDLLKALGYEVSEIAYGELLARKPAGPTNNKLRGESLSD
jgi:FkbM family methyltransferase